MFPIKIAYKEDNSLSIGFELIPFQVNKKFNLKKTMMRIMSWFKPEITQPKVTSSYSCCDYDLCSTRQN